MTPRAVMLLYQSAARVWLTLASLSLLLPVRWRSGLWLPIHLTLAGAISSAIVGAMQVFAVTLTAARGPSRRLVGVQFVALQAGVLAIAVGVPHNVAWLVPTGGAAFLVAIALLATIVAGAWRHGTNRRHVLPMAAYAAAISAVTVGVVIGVVLGSGIVPSAYAELRGAHMVTNVLGWGALTVVGTLVTLLPTVLRVQMPRWEGRTALGLLVVGTSAIVLGLASGRPVVAAGGGLLELAGVAQVLVMIRQVLVVARTYAVPGAGFHMLAGIGWYAVGSAGLAWALLHGAAGFDAFRPVFLTAFVGGFLIQVLLGAWSYLLPMHRPGHPAERRRSLGAFELGVPVQLALLNGGLALVALRGGGFAGPTAGELGVVLALAGGGLALLKAWTFPLLARVTSPETGRAREVWWPKDG